jgi:hypothetical protein
MLVLIIERNKGRNDMKYNGIDAVVFIEGSVKKNTFTPSKETKAFKTYRAIAMTLKVGEKVIVRVKTNGGGSWLMGYGEVERTKTGWIEPRMLAHEY